MSDIKPAEVSAILKKQLADVNLDVELEEVGTVLTVGDGIARVYGLNNAQSGELVEFDSGDQGIVLSELVTHRETDDSAKDYVRRIIEEYTGKQVELHTTTDPHMLGGFKMEFDHNMYDARLRTKIMKLRKEFAKNDYESKL